MYGLAGPEGLLHSAGFGVVNDAGLVPDENTVFPIASMSKSFVACAALLARDRGALSLEDPIAKWLPEFSAVGTAEDPCQPPTVRMLFSMSGGLTEDNSWVDPFIDATEQDLLAQVSRACATATCREPLMSIPTSGTRSPVSRSPGRWASPSSVSSRTRCWRHLASLRHASRRSM